VQNTEFRLAIGDAQRLGMVTGFRKIGPDTLAVDLTDLAMTSTSTEHHMGQMFAAYHRITPSAQGARSCFSTAAYADDFDQQPSTAGASYEAVTQPGPGQLAARPHRRSASGGSRR
jgi:hypothetical protein